MIQRKQSIYLALMILIGFSMLIFNLNITKGLIKLKDDGFDKGYFYDVNIRNTQVTIEKTVSSTQNATMMYSIASILILSILALFLFKKLRLQIRLVSYNFLFILASVYFLFDSVKQLNSGKETQLISSDFNYFIIFVYIILLILNLLALLGIKKDIELLASVNRMR